MSWENEKSKTKSEILKYLGIRNHVLKEPDTNIRLELLRLVWRELSRLERKYQNLTGDREWTWHAFQFTAEAKSYLTIRGQS